MTADAGRLGGVALALSLVLAACGGAPAAPGPASVPSSADSASSTTVSAASSSAAAKRPAGGATTPATPSASAASIPSTSKASVAATAPSSAASSTVQAGAPVPAMATAVVIGNDPGARPQAGLSEASVVWEILAEGWITRYLAIFDGTGANKIGPVRSARIYFDQLAHAYGIPYAHAGGNVDALDWIAPLHIANLDAIYTAGGYFWRGTARIAPDNLYTSTALLNEAERRDGFHAAALAYPQRGAAPSGATATRGVRLNYLTDPPVYTYVAGWTWQSGWWYRDINGAPEHTQAGTAIRASTVIVLVARQAADPDPYTPGALKILWQDGGAAWVLRGGDRWRATWSLGADGLPALHGPGMLAAPGGPYWYEVVPAAADVTFS